MRKFLIALILVATMSTLFAAPAEFKACTADSHPVTLTVDINDGASAEVAKSVDQAFTKAAASLPAEQLVTFLGFQLFKSGLSDEAKENVEVPGPPVVEKGSCKVKK